MTDDEKREMEIRGDMREFAAKQRRQERAVMILSAAVLCIAILVFILLIRDTGGSVQNA
jgi:predicted nucleic acid-binding Zn ribbon protein